MVMNFVEVDSTEGGTSRNLWDSFPYAHGLNLTVDHFQNLCDSLPSAHGLNSTADNLWTREQNNRWENLLTFCTHEQWCVLHPQDG